ncbi:MAG: BON domain-containing protein [Betaproteobacteria bacterium]|nr:BON domain-containing protein [Betaproteobacteria bacterium]
MRGNTHFSRFIGALLALAVSGCGSSPPQPEPLGECFDDSVVTARITTAISEEPTLKAAEIKVRTVNGVVQLSGFTDTQENIYKAVVVARRVRGVTYVGNDLRLR